jgi:cytochrome P450
MTGTEDVQAEVKDFFMGTPGLEDPHPLMGKLRAACPVAHSEAMGGYKILSRYLDIVAALQDYSTFSNCVIAIPPIEDLRGKIIPLNYDPPEHTEYRQVFAAYFTPRAVAKVEADARARLRTLLENFLAKGGGDFVPHVLVPFPCVTFLLMLGLPLADLDQLLEWKDVLVRDLLSGIPERVNEAVNVVLPKIENYFAQRVTEREQDPNPPDDVLTALSRADFRGRPFTLVEKIQTLMLFFQAGLDTVTGQLGFIVEHLATNPGQRRLLHDNPSLIPNAVEEYLRYFSIVTLARKVMVDTEVAGVPIKAGELVQLLTQSAGRDESQYPNAGEIDFERKNFKHLGFGAGPHRCIGSHLARMEMRVALEEMNEAMPDYALADPASVTHHWGAVAGVDRLDLTIPASKRDDHHHKDGP